MSIHLDWFNIIIICFNFERQPLLSHNGFVFLIFLVSDNEESRNDESSTRKLSQSNQFCIVFDAATMELSVYLFAKERIK